jgi:hypothetical protein
MLTPHFHNLDDAGVEHHAHAGTLHKRPSCQQLAALHAHSFAKEDPALHTREECFAYLTASKAVAE